MRARKHLGDVVERVDPIMTVVAIVHANAPGVGDACGPECVGRPPIAHGIPHWAPGSIDGVSPLCEQRLVDPPVVTSVTCVHLDQVDLVTMGRLHECKDEHQVYTEACLTPHEANSFAS